jgi:hypothetical protein
MAILYDGPVIPDDLTSFVRNVPPLQNIALNQYLPDRHLPVNRVDIGILTKVGRTARFRVFDGPIHVAKRDSVQVNSVMLPPLSDQLAMGELERLQIEFARVGGTNTGAFVNAIYNDAETLTRNVQRRMELARGMSSRTASSHLPVKVASSWRPTSSFLVETSPRRRFCGVTRPRVSTTRTFWVTSTRL